MEGENRTESMDGLEADKGVVLRTERLSGNVQQSWD